MSRLSRNIIYNLCGQTLVVALGFFGTRLIFHGLGGDALGILYFALALYAVLTPLLEMGFSATLVREVAAHAFTDTAYVSDLLATGTLCYWTGYAILTVSVWLAAPFLATRWLRLDDIDPVLAIQVFRVLAAALLLMFPRSLYANAVRGVQRMELNNAIEVATAALIQAGTIVVILAGGSLAAVAGIYFAVLLLSNAVYMGVVAHLFSWRSLVPRFSFAVVHRNKVFTLYMAVFTVCAVVQMEADKMMVAKFLPIALVGFYGVSQATVARVSRVTAAINQASYPSLASRWKARDSSMLLWQYRYVQDMVCYGVVPIFAAIIFSARPLFTYLLNSEAAGILLLPTALLCCGWYMNSTLGTPFTVSLAVGRPDINARQNLYSLVIMIPAMALLIVKLGLTGAALSFVLYHIYAYAYSARRWANECIGITPREWYLHVLKTFAAAALTYGGAWLLFGIGRQNSIPVILAVYCLASMGFALVAYRCIGSELRQAIRSRFISNPSRVVGNAASWW